jgi:hypothetical protein
MSKRIRALESEVSELRAQKFVPYDLAYAGVLYIGLDEGGAWRLQLTKARRAADFPVDMNDVL